MFEENEKEVAQEETAADLEVTTDDDESTPESETEETPESSKQQKTETPEARRARIKRQYEREFGKQDKGKDKEGGGEVEKGSKVDSDERYARLELKTEGVTSKKAQDIVLQYIEEARLIGKEVDTATALKSMVVKEALAEIEKKTSVPPPSNRTNGGASDTFEYWVAQAKKGHFPLHDSAMMDKLKKARIFTK